MNRSYVPTVLFLVAVAQACGRTHLDGPFPGAGAVLGGSGGSTGNGGMGGSLSPGGEGGSADCPPCLAAVFSVCVPTGRCVVEMHGSGMGNASTSCFDNGVRLSETATDHGNQVLLAGSAAQNGKTCYRWSQTIDPSGAGTITFSDGAGNQLALGQPADPGITTVDCGGKNYLMSQHCGGWNEVWNCDIGTCP